VAKVVKPLPSKHKALSSLLSTAKKQTNKKKQTKTKSNINAFSVPTLKISDFVSHHVLLTITS
jgi:hypothetical protein